jgi:hypothetical protein
VFLLNTIAIIPSFLSMTVSEAWKEIAIQSNGKMKYFNINQKHAFDLIIIVASSSTFI